MAGARDLEAWEIGCGLRWAPREVRRVFFLGVIPTFLPPSLTLRVFQHQLASQPCHLLQTRKGKKKRGEKKNQRHQLSLKGHSWLHRISWFLPVLLKLFRQPNLPFARWSDRSQSSPCDPSIPLAETSTPRSQLGIGLR